METVVSGIRSTGRLHLGNYYGAIQNFIKLQEQAKCFFFIADYHALTTHPDPKNLNQSVKQVLAEYIACGIDPERATIYIQSDVPQTIELYLLLNMHAYLGELERSASFKDKVRSQPNNVNAGLLTYPVLMAADILIHKATKVPVGKDQEQHLEMTRTFANRFNTIYKTDYFQEPFAFNFSDQLIKIPGLDGNTKMGKSEGENNAIYLSDSPEVIRKKVMRAVTDTGPTEKDSPKLQAVANLFQLLKLVSTSDTLSHFETTYNDCSIKYGDLKKQLAEDMIESTAEVRERLKSIQENETFLREVARYGASKARESASKTIREVREIVGLK